MLQTLKNIADLSFGTIWSISLMKLFPIIAPTGVVAFPHLDRGLSVAISILGLAYGVARLIISIRKAKQDERYREQEIIEKQRHNAFYDDFNNDFNKTKRK